MWLTLTGGVPIDVTFEGDSVIDGGVKFISSLSFRPTVVIGLSLRRSCSGGAAGASINGVTVLSCFESSA